MRFPDPSGPCRGCRSHELVRFLDLGDMPLANSFLTKEQLAEAEARYPLRVVFCERCSMVQLEDIVPPSTLFDDYAYFSSVSRTWVAHAARFADQSVDRIGLDQGSRVVEVASNDGYLLRHFAERGIPVLGVEPARNVAAVAIAAGIPTETDFFGTEVAERLSRRGVRADLVVGNNVLAHVPDPEDLLRGMAIVLQRDGLISVEFPHLMRLLADTQFDTIYHEHMSYLSLTSLGPILDRCDLRTIDVEQLETHGGSLRVWIGHRSGSRPTSASIERVRDDEARAGLADLKTYQQFADRVHGVIAGVSGFLEENAARGQVTVGYGAAAKGNILLNSCGVTARLLPYVVDLSPYKQGRFLPGTHIPVLAPDAVDRTHPDHLLILPWNLEREIRTQMARIRTWGGRFVIPIPALRVEQ